LASVVQELSFMDESSLKGIKVPVIMINPKTILDIIPNATIIVWADCGHFPELEQTERYLVTIK
jgi:hypothetical protein